MGNKENRMEPSSEPENIREQARAAADKAQSEANREQSAANAGAAQSQTQGESGGVQRSGE